MKRVYVLLSVIAVMISACQPRIEMDMSTWGDHAYIDNVEIIKLDIDDEVKLQEYYENETPLTVPGVRAIIISEGKAAIDSANFVANVKLKAGEKLKYAGFRIYHKGVLVEPIDAPKAGIVTDLTSKKFVYRLKSADGSVHDWTINIE